MDDTAMNLGRVFSRLKLAWLLLGLGLSFTGAGDAREQVVPLSPGWNAVALEVTPEDTSPAEVFGGVSAIDRVVGYVPTGLSAAFLRNPAETLRTAAVWPRWVKEGPETVLNTLGSIQPRLPYFIHATEAAELRVSGEPAPLPWPLASGEFLFVSLPVNSARTVTLGEFFAAAGEDAMPDQALALRDNTWVILRQNEPVKRGEVYCLRFDHAPKDYTGPILFEDLPAASPLYVTPDSRSFTLDYRGYSPIATASLVLEKTDGELAVEYQDGFLGDESKPLTVAGAAKALAELSPREGGRLRLATSGTGAATLRLSDGAGVSEFFVNVQFHQNNENN